MGFVKRYRFALSAAGAVALVVGFLLFRPDKLFVDDTVDELLSDAFAAVPAADDTSSPVETTTVPVSATGGAPEATTTTVGPVRTATGSWFGIDHAAEGTASVYVQGGRAVLRFEGDTDIQNGPDLLVWLLADDDYDGGTPDAYIDLGTIKGNVGGQNYDLPAEYDPDVHRFVLIWCRRFAVPFAGAQLT